MTRSTDRSRRSRSVLTSAFGLCTIALVAILTLAGSVQGVTPPTVLLGTAGQFAVLAGSGITNTGVSTISGDVGSSPTSTETGLAACPGANCVTLTGANHTDPNPNDATTQGAKSALTTAYGDAAGRTPTAVPTELGGQTLVGGVYSSASGTFGMTGTLTLDGENNADSVFIFQTGSTLITGGAARINLIRGAQACNVFWQVGSAATLGAGSAFTGTILAHDDVSLGDGVTVDGRLLAGEQASGSGAVTLLHDTITKPTTCVTQASVDAAAAAAATAAAQAQAAAAATAAAQAQAAAAATTAAQAQAAAAQAAAAAEAAANQAEEAARIADAKTAAAAAAAATKAAEVSAKEAAAATAAAEKAAAAATAAKVAATKVAAAKAATTAQVAKVAAAKAARAATAARVAKVAAAKASARAAAAKTAAAKARAAKAAALKRAAVREARTHVGFTG